MITAFLITTLVFFSLSLLLSMLVVGFTAASNQKTPVAQVINIFILLCLITWNIVVLVSV
jgi:hypothetical protein